MSRCRFVPSVFLVVALCAHGPVAVVAQEPPSATGEARILGRIASSDGKPVRGATVLAYHLSSARTFSAESDERGRFEITGLPYGYFDVAVQAPEGLFVADQVLNVPPKGKAALNMTLVPGGVGGPEPRGFVGLDQPAAGIAEVDTKQSTGQFFRSKTGIAVLAGVGGAVLLALALSGGDDEVPVSPVNP